jgi:hypothetical protein
MVPLDIFGNPVLVNHTYIMLRDGDYFRAHTAVFIIDFTKKVIKAESRDYVVFNYVSDIVKGLAENKPHGRSELLLTHKSSYKTLQFYPLSSEEFNKFINFYKK